MAYESDRWLFMSAVGTTAAAAAVLRSKKAAIMAVALATMMCNPGSMQEAAGDWQDDSVKELENLRTALTKLRSDAWKNGYWGGNNQGSYSNFCDAMDILDGLLAECVEKRKGSGGTLQQTAQNGHGLAVFATAVGGVMGTLMLASLGSRLLPISTQLAVGLALEGATRKINSKVMSVLRNAGTTAALAAGILATVGFSYESLVGELEKMKAGTDFSKADLKYVKDKGLTLKHPDAKASESSSFEA
ncbi:hypothetical protein AB0M44_08340 [Streptosporangium subroseum]|uniref:hypothetical protein n=1 Tax=Streptosporangium subroseum TaxID=106412 RepID=UPI00342BF797